MIWLNQASDEEAAATVQPLFQGANLTPQAIGFLRPSLSVDGLITEEGHDTIVSFCLEEKIIDRPLPFAEVYDLSFVRNAYNKYQ